MHKSILHFLRFAVIFLFVNHVTAQATSVSVAPQSQCANASGIYTINAGIFTQVPGATSYAWTLLSTNGCINTFTAGQHGGTINSALTASRIAITATCCGQFTVTIYSYYYVGTTPILIVNATSSNTFEIVCPYSPTVVASASVACEGQSITATELAGNAPGNYNWIVNGTVLSATASSIALTPSVNTCITFSPNSVQGCTNALVSAACVSIQSSQLALGNQSYTVCNNVPICLTLPPQTNTNVASGTSIPTISWLAANATTLASACMTAAIPGTYTALVSHTGGAGTCTRSAVVSIATGTALSVSVSPSVISVCSSTTSIPLSAISIQSVSSSYTWSIPNGSLAAITQKGNSIVGSANFLSGNTSIYTVNASYFGCAGSNTVAIKPFIINPVIVADADSICLGASVSLSTSIAAGQLSNYTINFTGFGNISTNSAAPGTATVQPNFLPATFNVILDSANCSAVGSISLFKKVLRPVLQLSNDTVCRGTMVTLTCQNVGYTVANSYSFGTLAPSTGSIQNGSPTFSFSYHTPSVTTVYYVVVDSAGCNNLGSITASATVFVKPKLQVLPNLSSATVCPGTALNLSTSLGTVLPWPVIYIWTQAFGSGTFVGITNSPSVQAYPSTPSVYSISVLNPFGCGADTTINVYLDYYIGFPMVLSASENPICDSTTIVLTSSVTANITGYPLTYSWSPNTGSFTNMNTQAVTVTPTSSTIYTLVATNQYGCRNQSTINITVSDCLGLNDISQNNTLVFVAPNPASDLVKITVPENALFTCYSFNGSALFKLALSSGESIVDLHKLEPGIYLFEFIFETNKVYKKIIVR